MNDNNAPNIDEAIRLAKSLERVVQDLRGILDKTHQQLRSMVKLTSRESRAAKQKALENLTGIVGRYLHDAPAINIDWSSVEPEIRGQNERT